MTVRSVILVPGLTASKLNRPGFLTWLKTVWINPTELLLGGFPRLALPLDDQPDLPPLGSVILPGTPLGAAYGPLMTWLTLMGWVTLGTRADWRRTLSYDGELLLAQVRTQGLLGGVGLVCHSRGGLLARYVSRRLVELGEIGKLEAVVTLGTPHAGSMNAVTFLSGSGSLVDRLHNLGTGLQRRLGSTLGLDQVQRVLRSWPSVYELLPDPDRHTLPAPDRAALYDAGTWSRTPHPPHAGLLTAAAATWRALPDFPASVRVLRVCGELVDTAYGFQGSAGPGNLPPLSWDTSGDGTVHTTSALWPSDHGVQVPCAHDLLPLDGRVWPYIHAHLSGEVVPDITIGGAVFEL